jgi:hypothetical protein
MNTIISTCILSASIRTEKRIVVNYLHPFSRFMEKATRPYKN